MRHPWPVLLLVLLLTACPSPKAQEQGNLRLGNPSAASTSDPNNYLLVKPQYVVSYNAERGTPNWVSWQLDQSWLGKIDRQNDFRADDTLPQGFIQITPTDYTGSGYDRGHLAPSADRTRTTEDNSATFLMTNMVPQRPDLNRGPWEKLERYCRDLVAEGKQLYIVAGVSGSQKRLRERVTAPASTWKVVVVLDSPDAAITPTTRVIAVDMPNRRGIKENDWQTFRTTVDAIEAETGLDLLSSVTPAIQAVVESRVDAE